MKVYSRLLETKQKFNKTNIYSNCIVKTWIDYIQINMKLRIAL